MTQHALLPTRSEQEGGNTDDSISTDYIHPGEGVVITLTLDAAQISAVVSAVQLEAATGRSFNSDKPSSRPSANIKLVDPTATSVTSSRHSISFTVRSTVATNSLSGNPVRPSPSTAHRIKAVATKPSSVEAEETASSAAASKVSTASSGAVKAVLTEKSQWFDHDIGTASMGPLPTASIASSSSILSSPSNTAAISIPRQPTVTVTSTATSHVSSTSTSSIRIANTSLVAKPVIADSKGIPVVTVYETTGTAFTTAESSSTRASATGASESRKSFFQTIDSSPTAKALTAIISVIIIILVGLALWFCMHRRMRRSKRRDSLFDFDPDATDVKSTASVYSEKTPEIAGAAGIAGNSPIYAFASDQASFGYDSRYVEAATSTPGRSPQQAEEEYNASTSAVRFAGIYPCMSSERRKSSVDLGLAYRSAQSDPVREAGQSHTFTTAGVLGVNPSQVSRDHRPELSNPASRLNMCGEALGDTPLAVPPRPARPASLSGSITKKIDEMYSAATPKSSTSVMPPVSRPWTRQARKWASMSSVGGNGPDRRLSVDRRLYQQQLPSRFSITTFATSVEASPDLGAFRPRRTAMTEHHLGTSMLRTDIFNAPIQGPVRQDANPFSDLARVAPEHATVETPSPMSISEPWASTAPLTVPGSGLQHEIIILDDRPSSPSSQEETHLENKTASPIADYSDSISEASLETASQASAIDEDEEQKIRALMKRRQSAK